MVKVLSQQSLLDLAIQTSGSSEASFEMALENGLSLTDELSAGSEVKTIDVVDVDTKSYYDNKRLTPATWVSDSVMDDIVEDGDGIEFWAIEFDFLVS